MICNFSNINFLQLIQSKSTGHTKQLSPELIVLDLPYNISDRKNDTPLDWDELKLTITHLLGVFDMTKCTLLFWHNHFDFGKLIQVLDDLFMTCYQPLVWVKPDAFLPVPSMFSAHESALAVWPVAQYKQDAVQGNFQG